MTDPEEPTWDHSSHDQFYKYYANESQSPQTRLRFSYLRDTVLRFLASRGPFGPFLEVADIGCGAGTQCLLWAELGHHVHGLDVNQPLLDLARARGIEQGQAIDWQVGACVALPWADRSMDVCLLIELLEHVEDWQSCLREVARVLRPGGVLMITTSNRLCPIQQEFRLPLYSWYPAPLKRYFERLATSTRPELANFAKYPAVNWFTFYQLRAYLRQYDFESFDRFDVTDLSSKSKAAQWIIESLRLISALRWLGHVATPGTILLGVKKK